MVNGYFKEFGMNNLLVESSLQQVEKRFNIDLGKNARKTKEKQPDYYKQFNEEIRNEASEMANHYEVFYCIERSVRELISSKLSDVKGIHWWNEDDTVPKDIKEEVKKRIKEEQDQHITPRSDRHIDYTTFGELRSILDKNWDLFADTFRSQRAAGRVFRDLTTLRNLIAHCCPLAEDEVDRLALTVKDWFRLME